MCFALWRRNSLLWARQLVSKGEVIGHGRESVNSPPARTESQDDVGDPNKNHLFIA
jgi:hypothetical protein